MEDSLAQKYDRIQQFATRDWLGPSSASLARLERIKANVYDIAPTSSRNLRPSSASRTHKVYTELDTAPPLATKSLHSTATAWGSNASIPELIKQQGERQTQRQASARGPRRPWSGRKVPPSPTQRRPSSETGPDETESEPQRRLNAFISVKGAKYDPKSRPPSGKGPRQTTGAALAELMVGLEELSKQEVVSTLEEFIRNQPSPGRHELARLSAAFGDHPSLVTPPPAPRGSPNPEDQTLLEEGEDDLSRLEGGDCETISGGDGQLDTPYKEISVKQPAVPQLLRRPTPEPVRLSMTIPGVGDGMSEPEEEEDNIIDSDRSSEESPDGDKPVELELQSVTSEVLSQLEEPSTSLDMHRDQPTPLNADSQVRIVSRNSSAQENTADGEVSNDDTAAPSSCLERDIRAKPRSRHSVHIEEERNITIDITPRDLLKPFVPRPPVGKRRPQSAVTVSGNQNGSETVPISSGSRVPNSSSANRGPVRPKSARPRVAKVAMVGVEYGNGPEKEEDPLPSQSESSVHGKRRNEVETMMSRISLSDEEADIAARTVGATSAVRQVSQSSAKKNYYEVGRESADPSQATLLTTKTIQLGDSGPLEQKSVSVIRQTAEPVRSALLMRQDRGKLVEEKTKQRNGRADDDDASYRTHSAIRRPTQATNVVVTAAPPRPESRMGHRHGEADVGTPPGETEGTEIPEASTDATAPLVTARPVSAPSKHHSAGTRSGRKSPGKMARRPHSARPPTHVGPDVSKLCSKSSTVVVASPKKRAVDYRRNREAVKALREGTLNKEKKYTKQIVAAEEPKPIIRKPRKPESESSEEEEPEVVPLSAQEQEIEDMHQKLLERGVNVSAQTLARGLLPPTQRGYDDCLQELPEKSSLGLLNQPEAWLGKLFRKYKLAEKALIIANERMAIQAEMEAKQAARGPAKKKKRAGKRKVKHKRSSTVT